MLTSLLVWFTILNMIKNLKDKIFMCGTRLALIGESEFAKHMAEKFLAEKYYSVVCQIGVMGQARLVEGLEKWSPCKARRKSAEYDAVLVLDSLPHQKEILYPLHNAGFDEVYFLQKKSPKVLDGAVIAPEAVTVFCLKQKPLLGYLEMHITDCCNLKCKGCSHFANVFEKSETSFENFQKDITNLSQIFNVAVLRLMGGEPLTEPKLVLFLDAARKAFCGATIYLVTNGLLIPKMTKEVAESLRRNNIYLNISVYPPTEKVLERIKQALDSFGLTYFFSRSGMAIQTFYARLNKNAKRCKSGRAGKVCAGKLCFMARNGKLAKCSYPLFAQKINSVFGTNYLTKGVDELTIEQITDGWKAIKVLSRPVPFCKYCAVHERNFKWRAATSKAKLSDYTI